MLDNTFFVGRTIKGSSVNDKKRGDRGREGERDGEDKDKCDRGKEGRREGEREGGLVRIKRKCKGGRDG